jgi:hypothetical protein
LRRLLSDAARTLVPPRGERHGPLPPLLLTLTVVTGLVDAVSYLGLGHVFVANMTGNVVFLGFALAGATGAAAPRRHLRGHPPPCEGRRGLDPPAGLTGAAARTQARRAVSRHSLGDMP